MNTIMTNAASEPRRYAEDRPQDCRYCFWWNPKFKACELGEDKCYYLLPPVKEKKPKSPCEGCAYARNAPCVGFCMKKVMGRTEDLT